MSDEDKLSAAFQRFHSVFFKVGLPNPQTEKLRAFIKDKAQQITLELLEPSLPQQCQNEISFILKNHFSHLPKAYIYYYLAKFLDQFSSDCVLQSSTSIELQMDIETVMSKIKIYFPVHKHRFQDSWNALLYKELQAIAGMDVFKQEHQYSARQMKGKFPVAFEQEYKKLVMLNVQVQQWWILKDADLKPIRNINPGWTTVPTKLVFVPKDFLLNYKEASISMETDEKVEPNVKILEVDDDFEEGGMKKVKRKKTFPKGNKNLEKDKKRSRKSILSSQSSDEEF